MASNSTEINDFDFRFAIVPKQLSSPFFQVVAEGCIDRARVLGNVECRHVGTENADVDEQARLIRELVDDSIDGIAVSIIIPEYEPTREAIAYAVDAGIPVITYDSDDAGSKRFSYVGTDNFAFGEALGKVLLQIDPTGGTYGLISAEADNVVEREQGVRYRLRNSKWEEHTNSPANCQNNATLSIEQMRDFATHESMPVKAIIPVGGWPMFGGGRSWAVFADDYPDMLTVCADTLPHQMDLLNRNKVNGLVGQIPFQMGVNALDLLMRYKQGAQLTETVYGTELHEVITVPLNLDPPDVDYNYIGRARYLGIALYSVLTLLAVACGIWTFVKRRHRVVRASQPFFLFMIVVGTLITAASILPMSLVDETASDERAIFDAGGEEPTRGVFTCTAPIWFLSVGFTTVFSALFAKTWRVNKIFHNPSSFSKVRVSPRDVMWPFVLLLTGNVITLTLMTILAPLEYIRTNHKGTDDWNRVISSYGHCQSDPRGWKGALPYLFVLLLINLSVLIVANVQAYQARSIQSEFSESHYIALVMACILQTVLIAGPVLGLVGDTPLTFYVVVVCVIFVIGFVTLLCIFVPKVANTYNFNKKQASMTRIRLDGRNTREFNSVATGGSSRWTTPQDASGGSSRPGGRLRKRESSSRSDGSGTGASDVGLRFKVSILSSAEEAVVRGEEHEYQRIYEASQAAESDHGQIPEDEESGHEGKRENSQGGSNHEDNLDDNQEDSDLGGDRDDNQGETDGEEGKQELP